MPSPKTEQEIPLDETTTTFRPQLLNFLTMPSIRNDLQFQPAQTEGNYGHFLWLPALAFAHL